ncbi:MAG: hypothetical protein V4773_14520 [Verrucomicrobiota bacterium]
MPLSLFPRIPVRVSRRLSRLAAVAWLAIAASATAAEPLFDETQATTLFAFDQVSIPFTENLRIKMRQPEKHPANPVVKRGPKGSPDSWAVQFYGSIIKVGEKYRMWYVAAGDDRVSKTGPRSAPWRVAYAESTDGLTWTKPTLGLVEYGGNTRNNLVAIDASPLGILNVKVLHEPGAPAAERYKMTGHVWFSKKQGGARFGTLACFVSPDGLTWKSVNGAKPVQAELTRGDMVLPWTHYEPSGGLYKWEGIYYTSGQNAFAAAKPYHGRVTRSFMSGDFRHWEAASAVGQVRTAQHTLLGPGKSRDGEQIHEGVSVWHRGNVLLGVSGVWHGNLEWKGVTIDLGFVISNDGVSFREPAHEWVFVERGKDKEWDQGGLLQAQGFENIGEQSFVYYGAWDPRASEGSPPRGGVGIVTVPRDRFGDLAIEKTSIGKGDYQVPDLTGSFVTAAIPLKGNKGQRFYLNADGLGAKAGLKVELLDKNLKPLAGFSGKDAAIVRQSGFQTPIAWQGTTQVSKLPESVRLRVTYEGADQAGIRFSALYIRGAD